ncbi:MAG: hypothetical protein M0C28_40975 [Candidatus Moduliflexus flocculans]|nr:hypothetical protein [Candidatus Moduliflexus flocculans]
MSTSQAYRDSDEMEAALGLPDPDLVLLAHRQPLDLLPTSGRWPCSRATASTARRRAARPPRAWRPS